MTQPKEMYQQVNELLHNLNEIEQNMNRLILLVSGSLNAMEKTVSRLRNELVDMGAELNDRLDNETKT